MADQQIQIGVDELNFQEIPAGFNCPGTSPTPTPSPTNYCATLNLKTQIYCDKYIVEDAIKAVSSDKAMSMITLSDDSIVLGGYGTCSTILDLNSTQRGIISKLKKNTVTTRDIINNIDITKTTLDLDPDFGTKGKINSVYYNSNSLKISAKFTNLIEQVASGQSKIVATGQADYKPLVARFLDTGSVDRTFGAGSGYISIDTIKESIKLLDIFAIHIQADNKILLFCNAYDLKNSRSLSVILRLTNSGSLDTTFNSNNSCVEIRSPKSEFNGSKFLGKNIIIDENNIYIVFESFSSITKNNVIVSKYDLTTENIIQTFGTDGYLYCNLDNSTTNFQNLFIKSVTINNINMKLLYIILNANKKYLQINKYTTDGQTYNGQDTDTDDTKAIYTNLKIPNNIFSLLQNIPQSTPPLSVKLDLLIDYDTMPCNNIINVNDNIYLLFNIYINETNNANSLGKNIRSMNHWIEYNSLFDASFDFSSLIPSNCLSLNKCDRLPEDTYSNINLNKQNITKYITNSRLLFGIIKINSNVTSANPIKLDRFTELQQHNIVKDIIVLKDNTYIAAGYCGDSTYSNFAIKTISLTEDQTSIGPRDTDSISFIDFSDFCSPVAFEDNIVVEECPCAPQITPTPTPTPPVSQEDIFISTIEDLCVGDIPNIKFNWIKNKPDLSGSYLIQITQNNTTKDEVVSGSFDVANNVSSGSINISVSGVNSALNRKTCIVNVLDISGQVIYSKIFVLNIRNCATTT